MGKSRADREELFERYAPILMRVAFTYVKNIPDAEDIVQEVFLTAFTSDKEFENSKHQKAWLIRVTINKCKNYQKSAWLRKTIPLEECMAETSEEDRAVLEQILALPQKYREVIYFYYVEGYSLAEIADYLGRKVSTVGTQLQRGRKKLRIDLEGEMAYE